MSEQRLIDANALKEELKQYFTNGVALYQILNIIDNAPTVEAYPFEQVQELVNLNQQFAQEIENLKRLQGEWISVSERLPNTLGVYNVTRKLNEGETIYFISDASYFDGQNTWYADTGINHGRPYLTDIIAWQPLLEPYTENEPEKQEMNGTTLMDIKKSIVAELEEKGIEPTLENITERLEEMTDGVNKDDQ